MLCLPNTMFFIYRSEGFSEPEVLPNLSLMKIIYKDQCEESVCFNGSYICG